MTNTAGPQFVLGGVRGTSPSGQGTYGYYWSSSAWTSATRAYRLLLNGANSTVRPADSGYKSNGIALRCLGKKGIITLKILPSPPATPPENSNHSTTNIQPMIKCVSIQWGWCWEGITIGTMVFFSNKVRMDITGLVPFLLILLQRTAWTWMMVITRLVRCTVAVGEPASPSAASLVHSRESRYVKI